MSTNAKSNFSKRYLEGKTYEGRSNFPLEKIRIEDKEIAIGMNESQDKRIDGKSRKKF